MPLAVRIRFGLSVAVTVVFACAVWLANDLSGIARYFPLFVSTLGVVVGVASTATDLVRWRRGESVLGTAIEVTATVRETGYETASDREAASGDESAGGSAALRALFYLALAAGYLVAVRLVGVYVASALLLLYFARREARMSWPLTLLMMAAPLTALAAIVALLDLPLPPGVGGW